MKTKFFLIGAIIGFLIALIALPLLRTMNPKSTTVIVVEDKGGPSIREGYRLAGIVTENGDSMDVLVSEGTIFNKKMPFNAKISRSSKSEDVFERNGIIKNHFWEKSFWLSSNVIVVGFGDISLYDKSMTRGYLDEFEVVYALTKSGVKIRAIVEKSFCENKTVPFTAKAKAVFRNGIFNYYVCY